MIEGELNELKKARAELISGISIPGMIADLRGKQYRRLVEAHLRKLGKNLPGSIAAAVVLFTPEERRAAEAIIDNFNAKGYDQAFWSSDAGDVLESISHKLDDALSPATADEAALFNLFQLVTMNFAWMAHEQKELRKFIGIKIGWFS